MAEQGIQLGLLSQDESNKSCDVARDEMNLAEFPLAVLSSRVNPKVKTLEFRDTQRLKSGEVIEREWIITGADKFGLPTSTDDDVVLGLMRLTMDQGFNDPKVYFTRYELLKILRWSTEGRSYSRLTKSLDRLSGVRVRAANAFFDNSAKGFQTKNFGIIDAYEINDERSTAQHGGCPKSFFIWSEVLFDSFKSGFIKKLDLDFYFQLKSSVSRRLYRFLDKHFYYRPNLEMPLMTFAFEKLGLSRNYKYVSSIKQQLEPALDELISLGFLSSYEYSLRGTQTKIRFVSGQPQSKQMAYQQSATKTDKESYDVKVFKMLIDRGITEKQAKLLLIAKLEPELERIREIIKYYDHLVATQDAKVSRNKTGFLYRAVETPFKFSVPADFQGTPKDNSKRAERRPIKSDNQEDANRNSYRHFVSEAVGRYQNKMNKQELDEIYKEFEVKMSSLKNVLSDERFKQALDGCVKDEIAKRAGVPEYKAWIQ